MTNDLNTRAAVTPAQDAAYSIPAIIAVVCVVLIFFTDGFDVLLAIGAILFGLVGAVIAISPAKRGGILSILSIVAGLIAAVVSIIQWLV